MTTPRAAGPTAATDATDATDAIDAIGAIDAPGEAGDIAEIALLNPNRYPEAAARRLRPWLTALVGALAPAGQRSLGVRFAGDRTMRRTNRDFRGKDSTTDVLSFPGDASYLGDILISVPQARRQAAAAGRDAEREIEVLLLHGVLHCLGHDHETDDGEMERLERRLRRRWIGAEGGRAGEAGRGSEGGHSGEARRGAEAGRGAEGGRGGGGGNAG